MHSHPKRLHGIFTPNIVPLDEKGDINERELRRYIDWLIANGIHGLYPNGSTGEFTRFTSEERRRIIEIVCDQAAGRVPVLAGVAEENLRETIAMCEKYHSYGARAVAIVSPYYYKLSPESIYAYFREIALNSPIDITLYNIPLFANPIDVPTITRLAELPRIIGIKDSSGDVPFMCRMIQAIRPHRDDFSFLTGWEAVLVPMLIMGVDGGTHATSGVVPNITRKLYDLTISGHIEEAVALQYRLINLFDSMLYSADFPGGFRVAAELRGFKMGNSRQPLSGKQTIDRQALQKVLHCLLSEFNVIAPPPEGCPSQRGSQKQSSEHEQIRTIAELVIERLQHSGKIHLSAPA